MAWTPPPNWPPPPLPGWSPPPGWQPDPAWGPPPEGWLFWPDSPPPAPTDAAPAGWPQQVPTWPPAALPPPNMTRMRTGAAVVVVGGVLAVVGAFGTWIEFSVPPFATITAGGMSGDRDGPYVLVLGILAVAYAVARFSSSRIPRWLAWLAIADGAFMALAAIADTVDVHNRVNRVRADDPLIHGHVGWGLILAVIASLIVLAGAITCIDLRRKPVPVWQPPMPPPPYAS